MNNSKNWTKLGAKIRKCYICGVSMCWSSFITGSHTSVLRERFTNDMLCEIWGNPIFVIPCCSCFIRIGVSHCNCNIPIKSI